uniref:C-type lectin domain-containing protein n=1 Tax=Callorhinchus milii TaxID=7868 RepID=A0A4W3HQU5_CALMI
LQMTPETISCCDLSPDLIMDRKYYRIEQRKNWTEAHDYCRIYYTDLISIRSLEEHRLTSQMFNEDIPLWIGLYNSKGSITGWRWINGDEFNYTHWKDEEPTGLLDSVICVAVRNGQWFSDYCNKTYPFTCYNGIFSVEYYRIDQQKNWTEARDYCQNYHTDLISIGSPEEHSLISKLFDGDMPLWIGLYNINQTVDGWKWINGDRFSFAHWRDKEMNSGFGHLTSRCYLLSPEMNPPDRGYHLIDQRKSWSEARDYCRKQHTDLVSIRNSEEQKVFTSMFVRDVALWIGLYNNNRSETGWKWINGDKVNYTHWKEKEPNGYRGAMICVAVRNGMWFDDYCNHTYRFMCYKGN